MKPSVDQLQCFLAVADSGHFTRAAERLGVSQSSLSGTVAKLEALLGVRLFDRHTRGCRLSAAGTALLPAARRLSQDLADLLDNARDFATVGRGRLSIAAPSLQCALLLPPLLRVFADESPGVRVMLHDVGEQQVHDLVRGGAVDLGIATQTDGRSDLVATRSIPTSTSPRCPPAMCWPGASRSNGRTWPACPSSVRCPTTRCGVISTRRWLAAASCSTIATRSRCRGPWPAWCARVFGVSVLTTAVRPLIEWLQLEARPITRPSIARTLVLLRAQGRPLSPAASAFRDQLLRKPGGRA